MGIAESLVSKQSTPLFSLPAPSSSRPNISPIMMRMVSRIGSLSFEVTLVIRSESGVENSVAIPKRQIRSNPAFHHDMAVGRVHMKLQRARKAVQLVFSLTRRASGSGRHQGNHCAHAANHAADKGDPVR